MTGRPLILLHFLLIIYKYTDWPTIMQIDKGNPNFSFHNLIEEAEKVTSTHTPLRKTRKRVYSD